MKYNFSEAFNQAAVLDYSRSPRLPPCFTELVQAVADGVVSAESAVGALLETQSVIDVLLDKQAPKTTVTVVKDFPPVLVLVWRRLRSVLARLNPLRLRPIHQEEFPLPQPDAGMVIQLADHLSKRKEP